jgi:LPS-assembly lipoprotein
MWSRIKPSCFAVFVTGLLLLLLSGCGFHMRGQATLPPGLEKMTISGLDTYDQLVIGLSRYLRGNGIEVINYDDPKATDLRLSNFRQYKEILVVGTDGRVQEYRLFTRVTMSLQDKDKALNLPAEEVTVRRDMLWNPDDVLGKNEEERVLREEMVRNLAQKIVERLGSLSS